VISLTQRSPLHKTQHSQDTDIYVPEGFEPAIPASDPRLRPRGYWDRRWHHKFYIFLPRLNYYTCLWSVEHVSKRPTTLKTFLTPCYRLTVMLVYGH